MYKLVCIDVDGTLLTSRKSVTRKTKDVLKKANNMGVHIVINTGRFLSSADYYSQFLGVKSPVAALNGSVILEKSGNKIMYTHPFKTGTAAQLLDICTKHNVKPIFYTSDTIYSGNNILNMFVYQLFLTRKLSSRNKIYLKNIKGYKNWMDTLDKNKDDIIKFEILSKNRRKIEAARKDLKNLPSLEVVGSNPYDIEVTAENVSKGSAAAVLAEHFNIKREEVMCIGDSLNDLSMIEYAGLGVAMGNADDVIKERASYITDTNDNEGVAKVIDKFILNA